MMLWPVSVAKKPQANSFFMNLHPKCWTPNVERTIKNPETDIAVEPEDQKIKAAKP